MTTRHVEGALALTRPGAHLIHQVPDGLLSNLDAAVLGRANDKMRSGCQPAPQEGQPVRPTIPHLRPSAQRRQACRSARPSASRHPFLGWHAGDVASAARFWEQGHGERGVEPDSPEPLASGGRRPAPSESRKPRPVALPICPKPVMQACVDRSISVVSCTRSTTASRCRQQRVCCQWGCISASKVTSGSSSTRYTAFRSFQVWCWWGSAAAGSRPIAPAALTARRVRRRSPNRACPTVCSARLFRRQQVSCFHQPPRFLPILAKMWVKDRLSSLGMKRRPLCIMTSYLSLCYNRDMKRSTQFRLTDHARALLDAMSKADGISHTAMLEIAIREAAKKRGIRADSGVQAESQPGPDVRH
jgi:hypothetical protein